MSKYIFWANSIEGLLEEIQIIAEDYQQALKAVDKHIKRQKLIIEFNTEVVKVRVECDSCKAYYEGEEHIDCVGHKHTSKAKLIDKALKTDNKYRKFKKLHSHHSLNMFGVIVADGSLTR